MSRSAIQSLTPREREILKFIAEGDSLAEIAQKLSRSLKTIESHRLAIGKKLNASNRVELAKIAIAEGVISLSVEQENSLAVDWICTVNDAIQHATGHELIERFCKAASQLPGVDIAAVCTADAMAEARTGDAYERVVMALADGGELQQGRRYQALGTPYQRVIEEERVAIDSEVQRAYPDDPWLASVDAQAYLGISLPDQKGRSIGGCCFVSRQPMEHLEPLETVIKFFAQRLIGAIRICAEIEQLQSENDRLQAARIAERQTAAIAADAAPTGSNAAFLKVTRRVSQVAGTGFLREFINAACEEYGMYGGGICAIDPSLTTRTLHTVSVRVGGALSDSISYQAKGTPCERVLNESSLCIADNVAKKYPADTFLKEHRIRGFCGSRLSGVDDSVIGVIWLVNRDAFHQPDAIASLLQYFTPRIGAELESFMQMELLFQERERLEAQLASYAKD
jgi:DNA-binding CsgD family transcriptional regulator